MRGALYTVEPDQYKVSLVLKKAKVIKRPCLNDQLPVHERPDETLIIYSNEWSYVKAENQADATRE